MNSETPDPIPAPAPPGAAPPTVRGEMPVRRPSWPTVIGVIAMVLSILGILGAIWALVAPYVLGPMASNPNFSGPSNGLVEMTMYVVSFAVNALLLVGAILLLQWRLAAHRLLQVYAVVAMVTGVIMFAWSWIQLLDAMQQTQSQSTAPTQSSIYSFAIIGGCFGLAYTLAFPTFLLIWFWRESVKRDMARWFTGGVTTSA